jgi:hypothetical protein
MAVHRRLRKAAHLPLQAVRRGREALKRRRARRGVARDPEADRLDERLRALAEHVVAGRYYEGAWQLFRFGHFKGLTDEKAIVQLGAWARRHRITVKLELRKLTKVDVIFLVLRAGAN